VGKFLNSISKHCKNNTKNEKKEKCTEEPLEKHHISISNAFSSPWAMMIMPSDTNIAV